MQVTLINSVKGNEVHGTDTGKRTGCGINLTRADNMSKYVKGSYMVDLKEITCEKCKVVLAKRIIKESQKELSKELKEESKRAAQGLPPIENEMSRPANMTKPKTFNQTEMYQPKAVVNEIKVDKVVEQPTYNTASTEMDKKSSFAQKDDILSQFAIPAPKTTQEPEPKPVPSIAKVQLDEELEQFAIPTPKAEPKPVPSIAKIQIDEELEQFAIPTPKTEPKPVPTIAKVQLDEELEQFVIPTPKAEPKPVPTIAKVQLDDELEQFAIPTPKAEPKPVPTIAKVQLDEELEQFAIPTPKAEPKPVPSIAKVQLDEELEQFVIPTPKAEPTISQILLDDELEELVMSTKDTEGRTLNIDDIDDMMIKPLKSKVDIDEMVNEIKETNEIKERSEVAKKIENVSMSAMDEISLVKANPVQEVKPRVTETVQKVAEIPTPKTEVQFQPSVMGNQQPLQEVEEQPDMQEINTRNSRNEQQIIYNELGQPLYPVYNDKGQLFYTAVAPTKVQQKPEPEPEVEVVVEDITVKQTANPTVAALIAANAKKKAVIEDSGVHKITEPIVDSVEAALSQLGASVDEKKSKEVVPVFTEYKAPPKRTENNQVNNRREEQNVPLSRAEIKRQKKLEKINNEFEKKLKERGFDLDETKRKKRATR